MKKNGKTLISATQRTSENIDGTKNLDGILLENVYIGLAKYYSAELSQKVSRGLQENRNKGLFTGGRVPIGYKVINKKVVIDEARLFFTEPATIVYPNFDGRGPRRNPARKIKTPLRVLYFGGDNRGLQSLRFPWWLRHREPPAVSHRGQIFEVFVYDCSRFYRGGFLD